MPQAGKPRRRWLRWTLIGVGGLLVVSAVGTALTEPTEDESQEIAESEQSAAPPVGNAPQDASDPDPAEVEPVEDPATGAAAALQCTAWDPPIAYSTSIGSCDESSVMGAALAHQVGLADSPESPAATIAFVSICSTLQGNEPKTYESPANFELAVLLNESGVCPGDLAMLVPA